MLHGIFNQGLFLKSPPGAAQSYMAILIRGKSSKILQFQAAAAHSPRNFSQ